MFASILETYGLNPKEWIVQPFGTGLINHTWVLKKGDEEYILQRINNNVFKNPYAISDNIRLVGNYLQQHFPDYFFITPIHTTDGHDLLHNSEGYFRVFPFVKNSVTYTTVENPELAFEAAKQFGKFTHHLSGFDESVLQETIPNFHNLSLRYDQFQQSLRDGNKERLSEAADVIKQLEKYSYIVDEFEQIKINPQFKKRVMHHDTKISNVLFDRQNKGLCVIDLDTVMAGFFISDVGDMMRTYLAAASEEETDFSTIDVREDYFVAILEGYLSEMKPVLTEEEQKGFIYAGKFMIYMQSIRFLADYLINDVYYGSKYEGQNFNRAVNQLYLLESLEEKEERLLQKIRQNKYIFPAAK
ncbi:MAG: aminoglycoside phosphotransferase family protein [Segetibacter sp.]|nr:aminoglycoside phosphotransferase family protein [Segetibacter sp.]